MCALPASPDCMEARTQLKGQLGVKTPRLSPTIGTGRASQNGIYAVPGTAAALASPSAPPNPCWAPKAHCSPWQSLEPGIEHKWARDMTLRRAGWAHRQEVGQQPPPTYSPTGEHLLSLGTKGMSRLLVFTGLVLIWHLPGGARLRTHRKKPGVRSKDPDGIYGVTSTQTLGTLQILDFCCL